MSYLVEAIIYLLAAIVAVPVSKRLGFGSVLGYLAAGLVIGPSILGLVKDPQHILHFAELGVVFLLFIIGLELRPSRLWVLRRMMFGLGSAQVLLTAAIIGYAAWMLGLTPTGAAVTGFILALSSTAFVLQLLAEKKQLTTEYGRAAFAILLFQDLAVIPLLAIVPLLGVSADAGTAFDYRNLLLKAAMIGAVILGGRYLLRPALRMIVRTGLPELFMAAALFVVVGAAFLMDIAGISMLLGAFIAGMLLADSEYRHELEANIAPFKALLLGLFFIAVGMSVNLGLLLQEPGAIMAIVAGLMVAKFLVLLPLARLFGVRGTRGALSLAVVLSQGGEFAFVLFAIVGRENILDQALLDRLVLAVAVSMLLTPFAYLLNERLGRRARPHDEPHYDQVEEPESAVIIAGYGRFGQIIGRILSGVGQPFTALEVDPDQVDAERRYGNKIYYGDASKLELLRAAGAERASILVLTINDVEASVRTAEFVARHFPNLTIIARARNRRHQHRLMDIGVRHICCETLLSSLALGEQVLKDLGLDEKRSHDIVETFRKQDERLLQDQHAVQHDEERLIQLESATARELETLLRGDRKD